MLVVTASSMQICKLIHIGVFVSGINPLARQHSPLAPQHSPLAPQHSPLARQHLKRKVPVVRLVHKGYPYESQPKCELPNQISNFGQRYLRAEQISSKTLETPMQHISRVTKMRSDIYSYIDIFLKIVIFGCLFAGRLSGQCCVGLALPNGFLSGRTFLELSK